MASKKKVTATSAQVFKRGVEQWRFRIKGGNGEVIATGEQYVDKRDAIAAAEALMPEGTPILVNEES